MATTVKSGINKVGDSHYQSITTSNPDGSVGTTLYRVNADGSGGVPIYDVDKPGGTGAAVKSFDANATAEEKKLLSDPNSQLSQVRSQQITSSNPFGDNPTAEQKQTLNGAAGKPNKATNNEQGDSVSAEQKAAAEKDLASQNAKTRDSFSKTLKYPLTLKSEYQDVIKFNMVKYRPKPPQSSNGSLNPAPDRPRATEKEIIGTVTLPIPSGIGDINTANWGSDELSPMQQMLTDLAMTGISQGGGAAAGVAGKQAEAISNNSSDVKEALTIGFTQAATGTQNLLSRTKGAVINPNMELLFLGPQLRPFNFTFKLSARSQKEAQAIRSIIRFFKQGMSPIRTEANLFLKAPHTFQIEYLHRNKPHIYLNKFKECALQSFAVDYTPEGQYATFTDGAMVSYQITMQFQELEPIFNDDYKNKENVYPDPDIGY
jgi:hypothetical protein